MALFTLVLVNGHIFSFIAARDSIIVKGLKGTPPFQALTTEVKRWISLPSLTGHTAVMMPKLPIAF
jgi:hypothetical protein